MTEEVARFLNAINSELEEQSLTPREFDDELRDSGELVFEYRDGNLHQIGYFPLRAVNDPIPIWAYNKDGHRGVVAIDTADWYDSLFDFANFASVDWSIYFKGNKFMFHLYYIKEGLFEQECHSQLGRTPYHP